MPADVAMIVTGIALVFLLFAAVLAWADYYCRDHRQPPA